MVGIQVEDELGAHPLLVVHDLLRGAAVVGGGVVAVLWDLRGQEVLQPVLGGEGHVPLHGASEGYEPELPPREAVGHGDVCGAVVAAEQLE